MGRRVAIVQSSYIPWKGYFDLIRSVDEFVLYDDAQYTVRDWRNRNRIKTPQGTAWLTVPVRAEGGRERPIKDVEAADDAWRRRHWRSLRAHYSAAPFFRDYSEAIEDLYLGCTERNLSKINRRFIESLCAMLGITTRLHFSMDLEASGRRTERLVGICRELGAEVYLSGPSARDYLDERCFAEHGIEVAYIDYSGYAEYPQLYPPFEHHVTVLDLLFHLGPGSASYLREAHA